MMPVLLLLTISFFCPTAFIPAPIYYGLVIQSTCLVFQESCGKTGNCLIYDTDLLVIRFWGMYLGLTFAVLICYGVSLISFRRDADGVSFA